MMLKNNFYDEDDNIEDHLGFRKSSLDPPPIEYFLEQVERRSTSQNNNSIALQQQPTNIFDDSTRIYDNTLTRNQHYPSNEIIDTLLDSDLRRHSIKVGTGGIRNESKSSDEQNIEADIVFQRQLTPDFWPLRRKNMGNKESSVQHKTKPGRHSHSQTSKVFLLREEINSSDLEEQEDARIEQFTALHRKLKHHALKQLPKKDGPEKVSPLTVSDILNSCAKQQLSNLTALEKKQDNHDTPFPGQIKSNSDSLSCVSPLSPNEWNVKEYNTQQQQNTTGRASLVTEISLPRWVSKATLMPHRIPRDIFTASGNIVSISGDEGSRLTNPVAAFQPLRSTQQWRPTSSSQTSRAFKQRGYTSIRNVNYPYQLPKLDTKQSLIRTRYRSSDPEKTTKIPITGNHLGQKVIAKNPNQQKTSQRILIPVKKPEGTTNVIGAILEPPHILKPKCSILMKPSNCSCEIYPKEEREDEYHYRLSLAMNHKSKIDRPVNNQIVSAQQDKHYQSTRPYIVCQQPQNWNIPMYQVPRDEWQVEHTIPVEQFRNQPNEGHCESCSSNDYYYPILISSESSFKKKKPLFAGVFPDFTEMFPDWRSRRQSFQRRKNKISRRCGC